MHAQNSFKNKFKKEDFKEDYLFKEDYQKPLKKSTLSFLSNPVPFNGQSYQKQKGPETSDQSFFRLWIKFRKIPLLVTYYLTKFNDVHNIKQLWSYFKNYIGKFMQAKSWDHKLFHFHLSFYIWKVWKGREKNYKNLNTLRMKRAF